MKKPKSSQRARKEALKGQEAEAGRLSKVFRGRNVLARTCSLQQAVSQIYVPPNTFQYTHSLSRLNSTTSSQSSNLQEIPSLRETLIVELR